MLRFEMGELSPSTQFLENLSSPAKWRLKMLLQNKIAVIYGAGGAIGGAVARAFAQEGARVYLAGRTLAKLDAVAAEISNAGGMTATAQVDALNEQSVADFLNEVERKAGRIDISFNAIDTGDTQGQLLTDMPEARFTLPIMTAMTSHFITGTAAARHMAKNKSGVILAITANVARHAVPYVGGFGVACAAIEGFCRQLAAEVGQDGIRVVCIRSAGSPDAPGVREAFKLRAAETGMTLEEFTTFAAKDLPLRRLPLLADIANAAVMLASDYANGVTCEVANLTSGQVMD
jgi:NAD(P)-dependent dehydrogenase (short-subunit alcohol dehydrogenase family)